MIIRGFLPHEMNFTETELDLVAAGWHFYAVVIEGKNGLPALLIITISGPPVSSTLPHSLPSSPLYSCVYIFGR